VRVKNRKMNGKAKIVKKNRNERDGEKRERKLEENFKKTQHSARKKRK
jgi:hypothetical protein